jgi:hypothetical protein
LTEVAGLQKLFDDLHRHVDVFKPVESRVMPEKRTLKRAEEDMREGKAPTTQAGEFVREEMEHVEEGKHGVKNRKQAVAIGLSKARRAGVNLPPPKAGRTSEKTRKSAASAYKKGRKQPAIKSKADASSKAKPGSKTATKSRNRTTSRARKKR